MMWRVKADTLMPMARRRSSREGTALEDESRKAGRSRVVEGFYIV